MMVYKNKYSTRGNVRVCGENNIHAITFGFAEYWFALELL